MSTYTQFLAWILAFGPKIPALLVKLQQLAEWYADLVAVLNPPAPKAFAAHPAPHETSEEHKLEQQVAAAAHEHAAGEKSFGAIGDGTILALLRNAWAFLSAHPRVADMVYQHLREGGVGP